MFLSFWHETALWKKVTFGLILGVIVGAVFGDKVTGLSILGDIFIRLIKMVMVPLIYVSIVIAIISMDDSRSLSRITIKSTALFLSTTCLAICIGVVIAYIFKPGFGIDLSALKLETFTEETRAPKDFFSFTKIVKGIIPDNALGALVTGNLLQVIFFAFFTGFTVNLLAREKPAVIRIFTIGRNIVFKMINLVLSTAPFGAFGFMAAAIGKQGLGLLSGMLMFILVFFLAIFIQYALLGLFLLLAGLSPWPFYKKSLEYQMIAISTSSSKATLPTTMRICSEKLGVSKLSSSFVLPLAAAMNMYGTAIYLGMTAVFFAQVYGVSLTGLDYGLIILTSMLSSIGVAGVPGGAIMMMPMVLGAINVPMAGIAFIAGIDRVLEMFRTALNITGDATITVIVDKSEKTLDEKVYKS